jgi:predicted nucleic acid-binding Zn ribbon protein
MMPLVRDEPMALSESLSAVVRALRQDPASDTPAVTASALGGVFGRWQEAVGDVVAAHVQPIKLAGRTLVVEVDDPAWATQLRFLEATVRQRLAEVAGADVETVEIRVRRG